MHRSLMTLQTLAFSGLLLWSGTAPAQTRYEHDVERVTAADVGPYRPQERPQLDKVREQIVEAVNQFHREQGFEPLSTNPTLTETAAEFAAYMARTDRYGHTADGRRPADRAREQGYEYCIVSENIAYQFSTSGFDTAELAQRFVQGWKDSPPHRKNMLDPDVAETGAAIAQSERTGVFYAVQMFGRPKSMAIEFAITNPTEQVVRYRIEDRTFELPPRYTRTHTRCRPADVELLAETEAGEDEPRAVDTIRPEDGEQLQIAVEAGQLQFVEAESSVVSPE